MMFTNRFALPEKEKPHFRKLECGHGKLLVAFSFV